MKDALTFGKVAGIVTVNVKGDFDGLVRNRLLYRLLTQGWPVVKLEGAKGSVGRVAEWLD